MGYEINISRDGKHYFSTSEASIGHDIKKCNSLYYKLKTVFPENEGYKITITNWSRVGQPYDIKEEKRWRSGEDYFNDGEFDPAGGRGLHSHE